MTSKRKKWLAIPALAGLAATAVLLSAWQGAQSAAASRGPWGYSAASTPQGRAPEQPIAFPHPTHVAKLGMNCLYCHFSANKAPDPGLPAVSTCMGCHSYVGAGGQLPDSAHPGQMRKSPELAKLQDYAAKKQPIPWIRIHKVPDYVNFPHMRHVSAGVTCQSCHGDVQRMARVFQYSSLNMGWCVTCHVNGYTPPDTVPSDLGGGKIAVPTSQPTAAHAGTGPLVGSYTYPRKARYDCAVCHY
ncbi:MAG: cytochrome c family protein [Gemmatimonadota bacterium]|nr:cytochrome c family protein [Gemmatimonadota bacterium]